MLFVKLLFIAASLLAQAHFCRNVPEDTGQGNVKVTVSDSCLASIRARIAAGVPSSDASPADSDRSRIDAPVASR